MECEEALKCSGLLILGLGPAPRHAELLQFSLDPVEIRQHLLGQFGPAPADHLSAPLPQRHLSGDPRASPGSRYRSD